ncbi:MAG: flagellar hook-associated protein FlgK [Nitrospirales bacterium]|nr:flagellar hook-associated protein FlgK [Nitrospira sp.]MDR4502337.1 flagellar hook-associated protein FlgK [Nitrospirales bacterium]
MSGIGHIFEIGRTGIRAHQQALATISHNISNIETKGYSRQEVVLETASPANGQEASGVRVHEIRRNVDVFLEDQITKLKEDVGRLDSRHNFLVQADGVFTESDNQGIAHGLTEFFNAVRDVATNPEGTVQRTVLLGKGNALTDEVNRAATALDQIRRDADGQIGRHLTTVNSLATEIATLNDSIFRAEASGGAALDLRDQRQLRVNELAELVDVSVVEGRDGLTINVGGHLLVGGNHANTLVQTPDVDNPPLNDVAIVRSDGTNLVITPRIADGRIKGLLTLRDTDIVGFQDRLDRTVAVLVNEFNQQHEAGYDLDGDTGNAFFTALSPDAPVASDSNTGGAEGTSVAVSTASSLTFSTYQISFTNATTFDVLDTTNGTTVLSGQTYTSGNNIVFDGLTTVITNNTGAPAAGDVFTVSAHKGAAADLSVALTDTDDISASSTAAGVPGNNLNALALVDIHTTRQSTLGSVTLNDYHTITAGNVGSTTREVNLSLIAKEAETEQVEAFREGVSGVSLDEELTHLLSFQRAFQASARLITLADDLLETVLGLGR